MAREIIDYKIPSWAICPLVNGDMSALNDEEIEQIHDFCERVTNEYGNANFIADTEREDYDRGFCWSNDIDNLGSDCYTLLILTSK